MQPDKIELVCPAGSLPALKIAVDNGADCGFIGFPHTRDTSLAQPAATGSGYEGANESLREFHINEEILDAA